MQAGDMVLDAEFTPRDDTLYAVEHYVQQSDGSYALNSREEERGKTGAQPQVDLLSLDSSYASDYDDTLTIAGDGSTVVKVRYTLKNLHTATFYNEDKVTIGKAYYYEGDTIRVPQSVLDSKPGYRPVWPDDASFVAPVMTRRSPSKAGRPPWIPNTRSSTWSRTPTIRKFTPRFPGRR